MFPRLVRSYLCRLTDLVNAERFCSRRPLGDPNPQAPNLALAVVLLVVIAVQAIFNAWQGMIVF